MSEINVVTKFEDLPNEILMECLQFLNPFNIFDSFDQLNYRFYKLIRNIPLHFDFRDVYKSIFNQFCTKILSNPEIKNQIYSLHLSNNYTNGQIEIFLSFFSLDEFPNLRSLSLDEVKLNDLNKLTLMLPIISNLSSFHLTIDENENIKTLLPVPSMFNMKILSLPKLRPDSISNCEPLQITNLTLSECSLTELCQFFKLMPILKYLNVGCISNYPSSINDDECFEHHCAAYLKQMVIGCFLYEFENFEILMKQTPNLQILTICDSSDINMIDANRWEYLITSTLPYLEIFQFIFHHPYSRQPVNIAEKFKQFQNSFWQEQHHWYTEYIIEGLVGFIYTVPYILNHLGLKSCTKRHANKLISDFEVFNNVTSLMLCDDVIIDACQYHFPNVTSLKLTHGSKGGCNHKACWLAKTLCCSEGENIYQSIKMNVILTNLRHLTLSWFECKAKELLILSEILKEAPQVSSIGIDENILPLLYTNNDLYQYLHTRIKKLKLHNFDSTFNTSEKINQFCQLFSNMKHLECKITHFGVALLLLNQLPKLSYMNGTIHRWSSNFDKGFSQFQHDIQNLNLIYHITDSHNDTDDDYGDFYVTQLYLWVGEKINSV